MISKPKTILTYVQAHPIKSAVVSVFTIFTVLGVGFGALYAVNPDGAKALIVGPPCCDGGIIPEIPDPIINDPLPEIRGGGGGGGGGTVTPPQIPTCELTVSPNSITTGGSATLSWTTSNATSARIDQGIGSVTVPEGSRSVSPTTETTYTMVATSATGHEVLCSDTIIITPVDTAPVCTLTADKLTLAAGEKTTIRWTIQNATFATLQHLDAVMLIDPSNGTQTGAPAGTYTLTASDDDGDSVTCTVTITTVVIPGAPVCTLTIDRDSMTLGEFANLSWTVSNATQFSINNGIGSITPVQNGSRTITPTSVGTFTYTGTAQNAAGDTVTCADTITVTNVVIPGSPACTLIADKMVVAPGETTTIRWTISNADEATLQHLDAVSVITPTNGSQSAVPGTYTLVARKGSQSVTCDVTITTTPPTGLQCTLDINRDSMPSGESATMTWTTTNATSFEINGADKDLNGNESIRPLGVQTHTYTGTATDASGNTVTCVDTIQVTGGSGGSSLACSLTLTKNAIRSGESSELQWTTRNADSVEINQGIGSVAKNGAKTVSPSGVATYEYVLTARGNGDTAICRASLIVSGGSGGGCTTNCGGGSSSNPQVTIDLLKPTAQPLAFVTLSQIPYTGIELGPIGTAVYWTALIVWSGAVAYILLFKIVPFTRRKLTAVGSAVYEAVDATKDATIDTESRYTMATDNAGFNPKPTNSDSLSIEDIVRGLSRKQEEQPLDVEEVYEEPQEEVDEHDVLMEMHQAPRTEERADDTLRFLNALMQGDRDTTFSMLRRITRNGGRVDTFIENVLVHLDSAYRARVDGAHCGEDVRRICASVDTALLEEIISALAAAIDTTYSQAQVGVKLALTRAHAIVDRG